jgi:hypothetical protein
LLEGGDERAMASPWHWSAGDGTSVTPAEAIAAAYQPLAAFVETRAATLSRPVLVLPDGLRDAARRGLIEALSRRGLEVRFLWRPVAAALSWCERFGDEVVGSDRREGAVGQLLALHLGLERYEATILEIVVRRHRGELHLQPARRRPSADAGHPAPWFSFIHQLAAELLGADATDERVWNLLWSTPWISRVLTGSWETDGEPSSLDGPQWDGRRVESAWARVAGRAGSSSASLRGTLGSPAPRPAGLLEVERWFGRLRSRIVPERFLGAAVTGPLAAMWVPGRGQYGQDRIATIGLGRARNLSEGTGSDILANGAALYSARLAEGLPTYLDTLPRLRTVVQRRGVPNWEPLLERDDRYVEGGQVWHRVPDLDGFAIRKGGSELVVALDHGEYDTIREVTTALGATCEARQPVRLGVSIDPGQGGARIEILPEDTSLLGRRRVFVEWRRMTDTSEGPDRYLERFPRAFPETEARLQSLDRWRAARPALERYLDLSRGGLAHEGATLDVVEALKKKDVALMPQDATAVDSNGQAPDSNGVLARFANSAVTHLAACLDQGRSPPEKLVRAIGYTSTDDPRLLGYLARQIRELQTSLPDYDLIAIGNCLRSPSDIARFAEVFTARLKNSIYGSNDWLKALAGILRYRPDATELIRSETCMDITRLALDVFERELAGGNAKFRFRNACLIVVYLLRRRSFDEEYLAPESDLAQHAKKAFRAAIRKHKRAEIDLIGGAVDLGAALRMMVDYIDRRGSGKILLGV